MQNTKEDKLFAINDLLTKWEIFKLTTERFSFALLNCFLRAFFPLLSLRVSNPTTWSSLYPKYSTVALSPCIEIIFTSYSKLSPE